MIDWKVYFIVGMIFLLIVTIYLGFSLKSNDNLQFQLSECQEELDEIPFREWKYKPNATLLKEAWRETMCDMAFSHNDWETLLILNCEEKKKQENEE